MNRYQNNITPGAFNFGVRAQKTQRPDMTTPNLRPNTGDPSSIGLDTRTRSNRGRRHHQRTSKRNDFNSFNLNSFNHARRRSQSEKHKLLLREHVSSMYSESIATVRTGVTDEDAMSTVTEGLQKKIPREGL